jgi:hypothetical protein
VFERLWRIKAGSASVADVLGQELLCRVVGSFRRELDDLPVWGRASVFVELGGDGIVTAAGRDWRQCMDKPFEEVKIVDPEIGADRVLEELSPRVRTYRLTTDHYRPELFALGYFSFPVRSPQAYLQPVYVAKLTPAGRLSATEVIVVPAAIGAYEPLRNLPAPPPLKTAERSRATQSR